jgi:hypothetical protein
MTWNRSDVGFVTTVVAFIARTHGGRLAQGPVQALDPGGQR